MRHMHISRHGNEGQGPLTRAQYLGRMGWRIDSMWAPTISELLRDIAPWAAVIRRVEGGWHAYESEADAESARRQR